MLGKQILVIAAAALALSGCATTTPRAAYQDVDTMVHERVGVSPRVAEAPAAYPAADPTARLLAGSLDAERAVEVALVNNATLRGRVAELGIAHADLVQASLVANPKAHASFRFPAGGDAEGTGSEAGVDMDLLDLLTRPLRKHMAAAQLEQAKLKLGHEILKLAVDVKGAFYAYQAALQRLALRRAVVESLEAAAELAKRQLDAGNISAVELANHRAAHQEALVELRHDEAEAEVDREKLALLMGVQDRALDVPARLPEVPAADPDRGRLEALALARRWDLAAARREPAVLADALRISRLNVFEGAEVGVDSERDFDGARGIGPDATVPLPVFDRRQGANAKVRAQLTQSRHTLAALEQEVRFDVRAAWIQLRAARRDTETYRTSLLPLRRELLDETLKRYNFMLEGVYQLLQAKREELDAQRRAIDAERDYWTRWSELERAAGGRIPAELTPKAPPVEASRSVESKSAPAPADAHQHHGGHE